eukprot:RCo014362
MQTASAKSGQKKASQRMMHKPPHERTPKKKQLHQRAKHDFDVNPFSNNFERFLRVSSEWTCPIDWVHFHPWFHDQEEAPQLVVVSRLSRTGGGLSPARCLRC